MYPVGLIATRPWPFILQLFSGIGSLFYTSDTGGIAYMAHIGGFVAGLVLAFVFKKKQR